MNQKNRNKNCELFKRSNIHQVDISLDGQHLVILTVLNDVKGKVIRFNISNFTFVTTIGIALRGVSTKNANIATSYDGKTVFTHSGADNLLVLPFGGDYFNSVLVYEHNHKANYDKGKQKRKKFLVTLLVAFLLVVFRYLLMDPFWLSHMITPIVFSCSIHRK